MPTTHRGTPTGDNHRPTPRLQQAIARQLQFESDGHIPRPESYSLAKYMIDAHRSGEPVKGFGKIESGPVLTNLRPYVGDKEFLETMGNMPNTSYDHGMDDAYSDYVTMTNAMHKTNDIVQKSGGTGSFIGKAVTNRKGNAALENEYENY